MAVTKKAGAKAAAVRKAHAAKVHASPGWAAKKAKVKAAHAAKVKTQAAVKRTTGGSGYSGPSKAPKGFAPPAPPIGRTSPAGAANIARQGAVTSGKKGVGAVTGAGKKGFVSDRMGAGTSKGVKYVKPRVKKIKV